MKRIVKKLCSVALILPIFLVGCSSSNNSTPKEYPEKAVQLIVPYKAGGDTDVNARIISKHLQDELGESVVIVNTEGGGGSVAANQVKSSSPDGYTGLFWHSSILLNELIGISDFTYDDFNIVAVPNVSDVGVWVVNADSPYHTVDDIVQQLKKEDKSLSYATAIGNYTHLQAIVFEDNTGVNFKKVDLGGTSNNVAALMGGKVDIISGEYGVIKDYVDSGEFRVIGTVSENRSTMIPDIPTFKEQGVDMTNGFEKFYFIAFPKETPEDVVTTFSDALDRTLNNTDVQSELEKLMFVDKSLYGDDAIEYIQSIDSIYKEYQDKLLNDNF